MIRDRQAILEAVRAYFAGRDEARVVLVFGSVASGTFRDSSDVDIAIAGDGALGSETTLAMGTELSTELGRPVDVVDMQAVEGLILREALVRGVRVKLDRDLYVRLQMRMIVDREDFLPLKTAMQTARIERFIHGP